MHIILLRNCEFWRNRRRKGHAFLMSVMKLLYAGTIQTYGRLKAKNVLVKSLNYVTGTPSAMLLSETDEADLSEFIGILLTVKHYSRYF
jgi:hypothetical protein